MIRDGEVVNKTLAQNDSVSITPFVFDKDEEIYVNTAKYDAFATVLSAPANSP